jgi:hypothetical protein
MAHLNDAANRRAVAYNCGVTEEKAGEDPIFEALWKQTLEAWTDEKRHAACLEHALREKMLPDLAGRYRSMRDDPERAEIAKERIDAILNAATQMLFTMKTPKPTKTPMWMWWTALLTCAVMLMYVAYALLEKH